jgi:opacity protein-like surface antigen
MNKILISAAVALSLAAGAAAPALAHHSFAMFDFQASKTVTGTVEQFDWTNPHTFIWLQVPTANGGSERYGFEGMSPNYLGRRGWSKSTLKPGDKVTVMYHPLKDGSKGGTYQKVQLSDGKELMNIG